jgi:uncharacterized protein YndB with AHSA1/START domain
MKTALFIVVGLAALIALAAAIGAALPANHKASRSALIHADRAAVWIAITDVSAFPLWRPEVKRVTLLETGEHPRWIEDGKNGRITFEIAEQNPPELLVGRIADPSLPFGGSWTYKLEQEASGTRITITEDGVVHNIFFRCMSRFVFGYTATMDGYLAALQRKFPG